MTVVPSAQVGLADALAKLPTFDGEHSIQVFERGNVRVKLYEPPGQDPQTPHRQDELYFVARGSGVFWDGADRRPVEAGAFLFMGAGMPHRFENFTEDFAVWVVYFGPDGGGAPHVG